jgi:chromate transporter
MAALEREFVERYQWLSAEEYGLSYALARLTPGTNVMAFCAATGWQILGWAGALAGTLSTTLPSAVLAVLITVGYESWRTNPWALAAINGTVAAVAGMMLATVFVLVKPYTGGLRGPGLMRTVRAIVLSGAAFVLLYRFKLSPLKIIGLLAVVGLLWHDPVEKARRDVPDVAAKEPAPQ